MASHWDPTLYQDEYRKRGSVIDEKRQGKVVVTERPETRPTPVVDLMEALQASVEAARAHKPGAHIATDRTDQRAATKRPARRAAGNAGSSGAAAGASKAELLSRAAELGIAGRSKMTRDELENAVAGATKPAKRRKAS
jgi:DNA end-binding protein Ku